MDENLNKFPDEMDDEDRFDSDLDSLDLDD
jgi:hypothetical protein